MTGAKTDDLCEKLEDCPGATCRAHTTLIFDLPELNLQMTHILVRSAIVPNYLKSVHEYKSSLPDMAQIHFLSLTLYQTTKF